MKLFTRLIILIACICVGIGINVAESHIKRTENADSIIYDDGMISARYNKALNSYNASIKITSRPIGHDTWHLTDPKEHYLRLKRNFELQQGETVGFKSPEEAESGLSDIDEEYGPNENF